MKAGTIPSMPPRWAASCMASARGYAAPSRIGTAPRPSAGTPVTSPIRQLANTPTHAAPSRGGQSGGMTGCGNFSAKE